MMEFMMGNNDVTERKGAQVALEQGVRYDAPPKWDSRSSSEHILRTDELRLRAGDDQQVSGRCGEYLLCDQGAKI